MGTGLTPEGIDQNTVYYEFQAENNWRVAPVANITEHIILRSQRRYNLAAPLPEVADAWALLVSSVYSNDLGLGDSTGVAHIGSSVGVFFNGNTPTKTMCQVYNAWGNLIAASAKIPMAEPFRYDLVNTGREVLAQLAGPAGKNFTAAIKGNQSLSAAEVNKTGSFYVQVLHDLDTLLATDPAFQIGPWLAMAKQFATENGVEDCAPNDPGFPTITTCERFYEWNSRTQITTWKPTRLNQPIPKGPVDYACKHWSGLVRDYYAARVTVVMQQALADAAAGKPLDSDKVDVLKAQLAYNWTTSTSGYPVTPVGDFVGVSKAMQAKYEHFFTSC
jgi:alpha-N-acetylglucosaminidase